MTEADDIAAWEKSVGQTVIRAHRLRRSWSQLQLAQSLNALGFASVRQTTIAKIESGERPLRLAEFVGIAQAFGMPWQSLMADVEPMLDAADPLADMQKRLDLAQRIEDQARDEMHATISGAVDEFANARARRITFAGELRRLSEGGGGDGSTSHTAE